MKPAKKKILVAIDFEEQSLNALEQSYHLANIFNAELLLLYVIETVGGVTKYIFPEDYVNRIVAKVKDKFDELDNLAKNTELKSKIPTSSIIVRGKPYEKIIEIAKDYSVLMIIMGKSGFDNERKSKYIGSNTFNVIRQACCPVVSMKGRNLSGEFNNILIPLDLNKDVSLQVNTSVKIGYYFGADINILSVFTNENKVSRILKQSQINQIKKEIISKGLEANTEVIKAAKTEKISRIIIDYAKKINSDMIIVTTQQKKDFVDFFVGSIAQELINSADIPVMSMMPKADLKIGVVSSFVDPMGIINKKNTKIEQ